MREDCIKAYDESGREVLIPRDEWERRILPHNLEQAWDDPQALYLHIIRALDDDFAHVVLNAAERLAAIDPIPERGAVTLAITEMRNDLLDRAEATLQDYVATHGETAYALTNLSKVHHSRGRPRLAVDAARRALELDPNQENGLDWYTALREEIDGEGGWIAAMREIADLDGAWRPHLGLAQHEISLGHLESALGFYRHVLQVAPTEGAALAQMATDLGRAGEFEAMLQVVGPEYEPNVHGPEAGLALAQACARVGDIERGKRILDGVRALQIPPLANTIDEIEAELVGSAEPVDLEAQPTVHPVSFEVPVWSVCLGAPRWLLPPKARRAKRILVGVFSDSLRESGDKHGRLERASARASITRCVSLHLAEALQLRSNAKTACVLTVIPGKGVVVYGNPTTLDHWAGFEVDGAPADIVITGCFVENALDVVLWDVANREEYARLEIPVGPDVSGIYNIIEHAVLDVLERGEYIKPVAAPFDAVPAERQEHYAFALEQTLQHVLVANGLFQRDALLGEHAMFDSIFQLAEETGLPQAQLMALTSVCAGLRYGSGVVDEFGAPLLRMIQEQRGTAGVMDRVSPFAQLWLGDPETFEAERLRLRAIADDHYRTWLDSL